VIGQTVSHYKITEKLGGGGMGVVYKAVDTNLDRPIALKFLPPELTRDPDAKHRFVHEAKAASALQHHNICTIHEIDETADGRMFISMDCYEGETLKEKIAKGSLSLDDVLNVTSQLAEGLAKAYDAGMIHRDVKPANVMVTEDGVVKILDFGLAKLSGQTKVTKTGTTVGTVAYMSPEQAKGETIDARSDIWSLGVVLYELLTGEVPFKGEHEAAVMYGVMHNEPATLSSHLTGLPERLQSVVDRALKKDPAERYQTATDLRIDLDRLKTGSAPRQSGGPAKVSLVRRYLTTVGVAAVAMALGALLYNRFVGPDDIAAPPERKMVAVLPFENLGPVEDEYFADGVTDEIITRLAGIHSLGVIARTSVMPYKNTNKSIQQIGEELGVSYIIEGTVRWQHLPGGSSRVRVSPQLIQVADETHLWADSYNETMTDVFQIQTRIAQEVSRQLNVALGDMETRIIQAEPTENFEAYTHYLRARELRLRPIDLEDMTAAEKWCTKAVELDSTFALAWAELAWIRDLLWWEFNYDSAERASDAKLAVETARRLNPQLPEANLAMGIYYYHQLRDYDRAVEYLDVAIEGRPSNPDALFIMGAVQRRSGEWLKAVTSFQKAYELDPRSGSRVEALADTYALMRR
jgi:non-specific serine/threonine protein kinase